MRNKLSLFFIAALSFVKYSYAGFLFGNTAKPSVFNTTGKPSNGLVSIISAIQDQKGIFWFLGAIFIVAVIIGLFFSPSENILKAVAKIFLTLAIVALIYSSLKVITG
jgi:hypothetical protein